MIKAFIRYGRPVIQATCTDTTLTLSDIVILRNQLDGIISKMLKDKIPEEAES